MSTTIVAVEAALPIQGNPRRLLTPSGTLHVVCELERKHRRRMDDYDSHSSGKLSCELLIMTIFSRLWPGFQHWGRINWCCQGEEASEECRLVEEERTRVEAWRAEGDWPQVVAAIGINSLQERGLQRWAPLSIIRWGVLSRAPQLWRWGCLLRKHHSLTEC